MSHLIEFDLADKKGENHTYKMLLHKPTDAGFQLMATIASIFVGPLAKILEPTLREKGISGLAELMDATEFNLGEAGSQLGQAVKSVDLRALYSELFKHVIRDQKPLSDTVNIDHAFAGNYVEAHKLAWRVIVENDFLPLPGI